MISTQIELLRGTTLFLSLLLIPSIGHSASGTFAGFEGRWRGAGTITMEDGSRETIRCKAAYVTGPDGNALNIDVDCASDSYRVHILSQVSAQGPSFAGSWQETTRQAEGTVTGRISAPGVMQADLHALGVSLLLSARIDGHRQEIVIASRSTDVQSVDISLRRS